jgi:hypothetical protein
VRLTLRWQYLAPMALALACGLFVLVYRGPLWRPLRAHGGDVVVIPFLCFAAGLVTTASARARAAVVGGVAVVVELLQLSPWPPRGSTLAALTIGSTFDPIDLAAYVVGLGLTLLYERRLAGASAWNRLGAPR